MPIMRAALITEVGKIEIRNIPRPEPKANELLIKVKRCALCTHEQRVFRGTTHPELPYLAGHEISGVVESWGNDVTGKWNKGDRVTVRTLDSCQSCEDCREGKNNLCKNVSPGIAPRSAGLGEYICLPEFQVFRLAESVSFEEGALTEPLSCSLHSVETGDLQFGDCAVVIGCGIMGAFHIQLAKLRGAKVIAVEPDEKRRKVALDAGADAVIDPNEVDQKEEIKRLTEGKGADVVFNTVAVASVARSALDLARRGGKVVMFSGIYPDNPVNISLNYIHGSEVSINGSFSTNSRDFIRGVKLINMGAIKVGKYIEKVFPLSQAQEAFEAAAPGTYRILINLEE